MTKKQYSSWENLSMLITHTVESNYRDFITKSSDATRMWESQHKSAKLL